MDRDVLDRSPSACGRCAPGGFVRTGTGPVTRPPVARPEAATSRRVAARAPARSASRSTVSGRTARSRAMPWQIGHTWHEIDRPTPVPAPQCSQRAAPGESSPRPAVPGSSYGAPGPSCGVPGSSGAGAAGPVPRSPSSCPSSAGRAAVPAPAVGDAEVAHAPSASIRRAASSATVPAAAPPVRSSWRSSIARPHPLIRLEPHPQTAITHRGAGNHAPPQRRRQRQQTPVLPHGHDQLVTAALEVDVRGGHQW